MCVCVCVCVCICIYIYIYVYIYVHIGHMIYRSWAASCTQKRCKQATTGRQETRGAGCSMQGRRLHAN